MTTPPSSLRLTGATVLRDGALQQRSVAFEDGRISKGPLPEVDLSGYLVLPGIVDLHGSAMERHRSPRPGDAVPLDTALRATDLEAAANGVTTAWLSQAWSWEGGDRAPDGAEALLRALDTFSRRALTDLRVQIRCETHTADTQDRLLSAVRRHGVDFVLFANTLDDAGLLAEVDPVRLAQWAALAGRTPEDHHAAVRAARAMRRDVPRFLCRLAEAFDTLGVSYGSLRDADGETREYHSQIGAKLCVFPARRTAAALARAVGDPVVLSAPELLRGETCPARAGGLELVRQRLCDALASDHHYPSLLQAAFRLVDEDVMDMPHAWSLVSAAPAEILRLPDRGVIDYGRRADLVVVNPRSRAVEATICEGRITHLAGEAAGRFLGSRARFRLAAE
ncbi:alpha-D-ribose 1-methylphosphonate 5-triphosphate diphosphatase [Sagittula stellata]|uniref:Alkylphosphonate utilization protein PhnM, putative n=1 Tax=Sagittula stellata (strain ATCC 700073 / DSM 11524 / E-37) TaxID=388399 RepID=A3K5I3_SAGS3|nr:alpha-D-ribose 1-methylphosphonate 5-triphosphate diphosphatase [Sagittula stellata]EBA07372.1 alkylphosphonate utilization protein PhnM, putative [Sagittula stellata E-37]